MSLKRKFELRSTVYLKKMALEAEILSVKRGHPNRYRVRVEGILMDVSERLLSREAPPLHFGQYRRGAKFRPKQFVRFRDHDTIGVVIRTFKYRKTFRHVVHTISRRFVVNEIELERWKKQSHKVPRKGHDNGEKDTLHSPNRI